MSLYSSFCFLLFYNKLLVLRKCYMLEEKQTAKTKQFLKEPGPNSKEKNMSTPADSIELQFQVYHFLMSDFKVNSFTQSFMYCCPKRCIFLYTQLLNLDKCGLFSQNEMLLGKICNRDTAEKKKKKIYW